MTHKLFKRRGAIPRWSPFKKNSDADCLIADSKLLTPEERERTFAWIANECAYGVGVVSHSVIDESGIMFANQMAMLLALEDLRSKIDVTELLIDGKDPYRFPLPHRSIIRGDRTEPAIAAGSIVAKVTRDRIMRNYAREFPFYGFAQHKGYGTCEHLARITEHGPCPLHRKSFLRNVLENQRLPLAVSE